MRDDRTNSAGKRLLVLAALVLTAASLASAQGRPTHPVSQAPGIKLSDLVTVIRNKAKTLESSSGMRLGFQAFTTAYKIPPEKIRYSDYVIVRLLFEATRDAGFWNLHWDITNMPPNSDNIWRQWRSVTRPSLLAPSATAECDELSALYAFLVERAGIRGVGLFWPYANHTVAVWMLQAGEGRSVRVVVPTTQIFLDQNDFFGTGKFNPWRQKTIYEYTRRDVPDSFELPAPLFEFFLSQVDKYAGASDATLQKLRYLREGVLLKNWTPEEAARGAINTRNDLGPGPAEDLAACQNFAQDMRSDPPR